MEEKQEPHPHSLAHPQDLGGVRGDAMSLCISLDSVVWAVLQLRGVQVVHTPT